jgi:hypothetical protein
MCGILVFIRLFTQKVWALHGIVENKRIKRILALHFSEFFEPSENLHDKHSSTVLVLKAHFWYALVWKPSCRRRGLKRKISSSYINIKETRRTYGLFCTIIITLLMKLPYKSSAAYCISDFESRVGM